MNKKNREYRITSPSSIRALESIFRDLGHPVKVECRVMDDGTEEFNDIWNNIHITFEHDNKDSELVHQDKISKGDLILDEFNNLAKVLYISEPKDKYYLRVKLPSGRYLFIRSRMPEKIKLVCKS